MTIEGFTTLEERGIVWQAIGFALIGIVSVTVLTVYSEADYLAVEIYRLAATELNWPFIAIIALAIDKVRKMFETRTEIRKAAREKAIEKWLEESREDGHKEGRQEGHKEGRQEGHREGRQEGHREGRQEGHQAGREAGREEGERQSAERIRASLLKHGIELPPELEHELFENGSQS